MTQGTGNPLIDPLLPEVNPADMSPYKQFVSSTTIVGHYGGFQPC